MEADHNKKYNGPIFVELGSTFTKKMTTFHIKVVF